MDLKGKSYMQVLIGFNGFEEENKFYNVKQNFLTLTDDTCVAHTAVTLFDESGKLTRRVLEQRKETKKDFADFVEKAEQAA